MSSPSDHTDSDLPPVDERLVAPGIRYEIDDGKLVWVAPADEPHGVGHGALGALLRAHRSDDRSVAIDMLTRTSETSDIAPDASVYPTARDPMTGGRQLEELAFELLATSSLARVGAKAAQLAARGVRRVFGIDLTKRRVVEWSPALGTWSILATDGAIVDPALAVPLPHAALLDAATADDATVRAFRERRHPEFLAEREEGREEGRKDLVREMLVAKFGALEPVHEARLVAADRGALERYARRLVTAAALDDVLAD